MPSSFDLTPSSVSSPSPPVPRLVLDDATRVDFDAIPSHDPEEEVPPAGNDPASSLPGAVADPSSKPATAKPPGWSRLLSPRFDSKASMTLEEPLGGGPPVSRASAAREGSGKHSSSSRGWMRALKDMATFIRRSDVDLRGAVETTDDDVGGGGKPDAETPVEAMTGGGNVTAVDLYPHKRNSRKAMFKRNSHVTQSVAYIPSVLIPTTEAPVDHAERHDVLHPTGRFMSYWQVVQVTFVLYTIIYVPIEIVFGTQLSLALFNLLRDLFLFVDLNIKLRLAYFQSGTLVRDRRLIRRRYARTFLLLDALSCTTIVIDALSLEFGESQWRYTKAVALLRVVRFWHEASAENASRSMKLVMLFLYFVLVSHTLTCARLLVWFGDAHQTSGWISAYLASLFWVLGTMTGLYEPAVSLGIIQTIFGVVLSFTGIFILGIIIANLNEIVSQQDTNIISAQQQLSNLTLFAAHHHLPSDVGATLLQFQNYRWDRDHGFSVNELHDVLPDGLAISKDVSLFMAHEMVLKVGFLRHVPEILLGEIAHRLEHRLYAPDEVIVQENDTAHRFMGLIGFGQVRVLKQGVQINAIPTGGNFGARALFIDEPHPSTVISTGFTDVYVLHKADFDDVMAIYPDEAALMEKEVAQLRNFEMKMDRKVIADHRRRSTFTPPTSVRPSVVAASPGTRRLARIAPSFVRRDSWRTWAYWRAWLSRSVHPHSFLPRVLSRAVQVVSVFNCLSVPVRIAFYSSVSVPVYLAVLNALCDICLWAFVFVKSRVAYYFMGELVTDIKLVRRRYLREWALYDLVACFPTEVFVGYRSTPVHRLARILTMRYIFNLSLTSRKMVAVRPITKLALALLQFILFVHFVACSYWILTFIDGFAPDEASELTHKNTVFLPTVQLSTETFVAKYGHCVQFSLKLLTGRGPALNPETDAQLVFAIVTIVAGLFAMALIISNVASLVIAMNPLLRAHQASIQNVDRFTSYKGFPDTLRQRIHRLMAQRWEMEQGVTMETAMDNLPSSLRSTIRKRLILDNLQRVSIFANMKDSDLVSLVDVRKFVVLPPGECVYHRGQLGADVYVLESGEVVMENSSGHRMHLAQGSLFGEELAVSVGSARAATVKCVAPCSLIVIASANVHALLADDIERRRVNAVQNCDQDVLRLLQAMVDQALFVFSWNDPSSKTALSMNLQSGDAVHQWMIDKQAMNVSKALQISNRILYDGFLQPRGLNPGNTATPSLINPVQLYQLCVPLELTVPQGEPQDRPAAAPDAATTTDVGHVTIPRPGRRGTGFTGEAGTRITFSTTLE